MLQCQVVTSRHVTDIVLQLILGFCIDAVCSPLVLSTESDVLERETNSVSFPENFTEKTPLLDSKTSSKRASSLPVSYGTERPTAFRAGSLSQVQSFPKGVRQDISPSPGHRNGVETLQVVVCHVMICCTCVHDHLIWEDGFEKSLFNLSFFCVFLSAALYVYLSSLFLSVSFRIVV